MRERERVREREKEREGEREMVVEAWFDKGVCVVCLFEHRNF